MTTPIITKKTMERIYTDTDKKVEDKINELWKYCDLFVITSTLNWEIIIQIRHIKPRVKIRYDQVLEMYQELSKNNIQASLVLTGWQATYWLENDRKNIIKNLKLYHYEN